MGGYSRQTVSTNEIEDGAIVNADVNASAAIALSKMALDLTTHASRHENGGADEISVTGLVGQMTPVPLGTKVADITHADTNEHSLTATNMGLPETTEVLFIFPSRISGSGVFSPRSVSGGLPFGTASNTSATWFRAADDNFYYNLSVANDDWDLYVVGYLTEEA